jgi:hypothetical protein
LRGSSNERQQRTPGARPAIRAVVARTLMQADEREAAAFAIASTDSFSELTNAEQIAEYALVHRMSSGMDAACRLSVLR